MNAPSFLRRVAHRVRNLTRRSDIEQSMDAEMRYHIECETNDAIRAGVAPDEARRNAVRDFGGTDRHKEQARDQRGFRRLEEFAHDARHTLRVLRRHPAYTSATVLTFALGIGLSTAIFSVVHAVLLRPLPYAQPDRLAVLWERNPTRGAEQNVISVPNFEAWRAQSHSFSGMAALVPSPVTLSGSAPERIMGAEVSPGYFHLLGVLPALGRDFSEGDATAGAAPAVVLSDGLWQRQFGADRAIVGRVISLDEKPFTVIGVMPADFDAPHFGWLPAHQLWLPFAVTPSNRSWGRFLLVVARLRDGVSLETARRDVAAVADQRARDDKANAGWSATAVGLTEQITGDVRRPLLVLLGAVGLLLLMAATNVGSLIIGFTRRRAHELALRRAIGASAGRIVRELLAHSAVLGAVGAAVGLAAAIVGTKALSLLIPSGIPRGSSVHVDGAVLLFTTAAALVATAAFGVAAAFRGTSGLGLAPNMARAAGRSTARVGGGSLVVAEIALGLVLTVLAGLMVRSFANLRAVKLGFDANSVVTARISLPSAAYDTPDRQRAFFDGLGERVRALPGVQAVSFATTRPFACCAPATTALDAAAGKAAGAPEPTVDVRFVDSSFFAALRIPSLAGRGFATHEPADGPARVVINQSLARSIWHDANPIGRTLRLALFNDMTAEVIGVVGDVHLTGARTPARGTAYLSANRYPSSVRDIIVRADGNPDATIAAMRSALAASDPRLPLDLLATLSGEVDNSFAKDRFTMLILSVFAVVSLVLAAVGVYGVFAGEVSARSKEVGIRLALGARPSGVVLLIVQRAVKLSLTGAAIGIAGGLAAAHSMSALVFGVGTADPASFVVVGMLLLVIAVCSTLIPAARAARTSPLDAIRND